MERKWIWRRWQYDSANGVINLFTNTDMSDILWMQHLSIFSMRKSVAKMFRYILKGLLVLPCISDHGSLLAGKWSQQSETDKDWNATHLAGSQRLFRLCWLKEGKCPDKTRQDSWIHLTSCQQKVIGSFAFCFPGQRGGCDGGSSVSRPWPCLQHPRSASPAACSALGLVLLPWAQPDRVSVLAAVGALTATTKNHRIV